MHACNRPRRHRICKHSYEAHKCARAHPSPAVFLFFRKPAPRRTNQIAADPRIQIANGGEEDVPPRRRRDSRMTESEREDIRSLQMRFIVLSASRTTLLTESRNRQLAYAVLLDLNTSRIMPIHLHPVVLANVKAAMEWGALCVLRHAPTMNFEVNGNKDELVPRFLRRESVNRTLTASSIVPETGSF